MSSQLTISPALLVRIGEVREVLALDAGEFQVSPLLSLRVPAIAISDGVPPLDPHYSGVLPQDRRFSVDEQHEPAVNVHADGDVVIGSYVDLKVILRFAVHP